MSEEVDARRKMIPERWETRHSIFDGGDAAATTPSTADAPAPRHTSGATSLAAMHAAIRALPDATAIYIRESAVGPDLPWQATYLLRREAGGFSGAATFAVTGRPTLRDVPLVVPLAIAHGFLHTLATVRPRAGTYRLAARTTASYPRIAIHLVAPAGNVTFISDAPDQRQIPWAVGHDGAVGLAIPTRPHRALARLRPQLRGDLLATLRREPGVS